MLLLQNEHLLLHHVDLHLNGVWGHPRCLVHELLLVSICIQRLECGVLVCLTDLLNSRTQLVVAVLIKQVLVTVDSALMALTLSLRDRKVFDVIVLYKT